MTVVAGGWSVRNLAIDKLCGHVIGVNDAGYHLPRVDTVVSMDRLWAEHRWPWLANRGGATWLRRSAVQNINTHRALTEGWLHVFECDHESSEFAQAADRLNGTNSGMCALNLAWLLRPRRCFLLGFDMCRDKHGAATWYPPYQWAAPKGSTTNGKYAQWATQFQHAARMFAAIGCEVWNVSPSSAIRVFPKMSPAQYAQECNT